MSGTDIAYGVIRIVYDMGIYPAARKEALVRPCGVSMDTSDREAEFRQKDANLVCSYAHLNSMSLYSISRIDHLCMRTHLKRARMPSNMRVCGNQERGKLYEAWMKQVTWSILLRPSYAISGTHIAYGALLSYVPAALRCDPRYLRRYDRASYRATRVLRAATRCPVLTLRMLPRCPLTLRACDAMSATEIAYGASRRYSLRRCVTTCSRVPCPILLRTPWSGTDGA
eukprot:3549288-Rhodomonas_salina.1